MEPPLDEAARAAWRERLIMRLVETVRTGHDEDWDAVLDTVFEAPTGVTAQVIAEVLRRAGSSEGAAYIKRGIVSVDDRLD